MLSLPLRPSRPRSSATTSESLVKSHEVATYSRGQKDLAAIHLPSTNKLLE